MSGPMSSYKEARKTTHFYEPCKELQQIRIDYDGLVAYSREKGVSVPELSDEEKNRFILNSDMSRIMDIRKAEAARVGVSREYM